MQEYQIFFVALHLYKPITLFKMDTIANIVVHLSDTIAIATAPKEVIFHSCPVATSKEDIFLALAIGVIILVGLTIIGHYVCKGLSATQLNSLNELKSRQEHEIAKLNKEAEIKTATIQFNAKQTKEQREWLSEADQLKNDIERQNVRLKEAETDAKISKLKREKSTEIEQIES